MTIPIILSILFVTLITFIIIFLNKDRKNRLKLMDDFYSIQRKYNVLRASDTFDIEKFNRWFISPKSPEIYANAGIFGRVDKLSREHFIQYFIHLGMSRVESLEFCEENSKKVYEFEAGVTKNWLNR